MQNQRNQTEQEWASWRAAAEAAAVEAGGLIRRMVAGPLQLTAKGFRDLVTDADLAAQQQITDTIRARFPDHSFLVEEKDSTLPTSGSVRWIIDPVDGTSNYSQGIPIFCVSIAVAVGDSIVAGAIYDPMREELFSAGRGQGCTLNGQPMRVSATHELGEATVNMEWGRRYEIRQKAMDTLLRFAHEVRGIRTIGSAALALAWIAAGRLDAYLQFSLSAWDVAAGALLVQEAGGVIVDVTGQPLAVLEATTCLATNGLIHNRFFELIRSDND